MTSVCPLSFAEVKEKGFFIGFKDGHDCQFDAGDTFSGVIVKKTDDTLFLE